MEKIIKNIILLFLPAILLFASGCADSMNAPDKLPPLVELYKPAKGDSVVWGKKLISYYASDDQKLATVELYVNGISVSTYTPSSDGNIPEIYWQIDSSLVGKTVSIKLRATDNAGHEAYSNENTGIIISENTLPPAAPKNLVINKLSETAVNLSWEDSSSNESEFQVWRKEDNGTYALIQTLPKNSVTTNDYNLKASSVYTYKVVAKNKYGSASSNEASTSEVKNLPAYITNIVAKGTTRVQIYWLDNATNDLGFVIQRKQYGSYSEVARTLPNATYFEDSSLSANSTYTYRIAAIYQTGFSEWSNEKTVTTLSQNTLPPSGLTSIFDSNNRVVYLTWNNGTTYNGTKVERKTGASGSWAEIGTTQYNNSTYSDYSIVSGNTYYYRVKGLLYSGEYTSYSNESSVNIPVLPPKAPANLTLTRITNTIFNLKWEDMSDDEDGFEIWRKDGDDASADYKFVYSVGKNSISANDQVTSESITYYYKIRAYRGSDKSAFSNVINSTGGTGNLPRPTNVSASASKNSVVLNWTYPSSPSNILGFEIERKLNWETNFTKIKTVLPSVRQYTDADNITTSLIYIYRIRAITNSETSDYSDNVAVTIPQTKVVRKR
ncbi:MAG: fibronectin type III domain-containing protein [Bacteroidota bacterium]|nr:fibronectin type III domain-containing protein [Bacteroidota bacterium]